MTELKILLERMNNVPITKNYQNNEKIIEWIKLSNNNCYHEYLIIYLET